ncbi:MAG TPA: glutamine--fructose-6-phosphate transaminase (isomerizing) [Vampirovibrionales bacterium]
MCGIVGYIGKKDALGFLLDSLSVLEYRGYDSTGIAIADSTNTIKVLKAQGKLKNLIELSQSQDMRGGIGIGHTRWATQGMPSDLNAHPHTNSSCSIALVHNGIVSNYSELKKELRNIKFSSETDSEVIAHLIGGFVDQGLSLKEATIKSTNKMKGSYALSIISKKQNSNDAGKILLTCKEAPLIIGIGKDKELYCASDTAALIKYTNQFIRLKDRQIAELHEDGNVLIFEADEPNKAIKPDIQTLNLDPILLDKAGYKHYLLKEIFEQPNIVRQLLKDYLNDNLEIEFPLLKKESLINIDKITIIGCGTAFYAGMVGKFLLEAIAKVPCEIELASEVLTKPPLVNEKTLVIAISQSGETADTLLAAKMAVKQKAQILALTNKPESSLASLANSVIYLNAGVEVSVAATKSFSAQMLCLYLLTVLIAEVKNSNTSLVTIKKALRSLPVVMEQTLERSEVYREKILPYAHKKGFIYLGRGINHPIALEGALKLKELTYIHATGYAAGEMKHGPIATIDEEVPTLSLILKGISYHKTLHNMIEAQTRGAPALAVVEDGDEEASEHADVCFYIPKYSEILEPDYLQDVLSPFISVLPLQLISYHMAEYLGKDVDQPRNLAKSVTVE